MRKTYLPYLLTFIIPFVFTWIAGMGTLQTLIKIFAVLGILSILRKHQLAPPITTTSFVVKIFFAYFSGAIFGGLIYLNWPAS